MRKKSSARFRMIKKKYWPAKIFPRLNQKSLPINQATYKQLSADFSTQQVTLVAVSKTKPVPEIKELYDLGQKDFGENYVQELVAKQQQLPNDIRWHFIGHLQSNKVKLIAPFIHLVQSVDSLKLLGEINKQASKNNRIIDCLLQVHIAAEETKFGFDEQELTEILPDLQLESYAHVRVKGLMGMASFTDDMAQVSKEFRQLRSIFERAKESAGLPEWNTLSMGMSSDFKVAIDEGSTMVRIGSLLFGSRN